MAARNRAGTVLTLAAAVMAILVLTMTSANAEVLFYESFENLVRSAKKGARGCTS